MRDRIEAGLEALGHTVYRRAWWVLAGVLLLLAAGATQIPRIEVKVATDDFLRADDPVRLLYDDFRERFGRDDIAIIAIQPPDVFELSFLEKLRELHEALENEVPYLADVQSLVNARETRGEDDALIVGELLEDWPETEADLASVRERALANPLYRGLIFNDDATLTTITLELESFVDQGETEDVLAGFDELDEPDEGTEESRPKHLSGDQEREAAEAIEAILDRYRGADFIVHTGGAPLLNVAMMNSLARDIVLFTALSLLVIAIFLFVVFRRLLSLLVPLSVALLSVVATLSAMGTFGIPAMPISEIIPSFLLAVGVGGTVHLLVIFQQRLLAGASREDALAGALGHSGLPIIMTAVTTAGGLASFMAARLVPIAVFGTVAPLGILVCLALTLTLAPALIAILPLRPFERAEGATAPSIRVLTRMGDWATANPGRVIGACVALLVLAVVGMLRLEFSFNSLEWFPEDLPARVASNLLDEELGGAMALELLIETGEENGLHDPAVLTEIDRVQKTLAGLEVGDVRAGKSISIVDIVKETHQALSGGAPETRVVPQDARLVAQELLLFENSGSDDLEDVVDPQFSVARFTMRLPFTDASQYPAFGREVARIFEARLSEGTRVIQTGLMTIMGGTLKATIETMVRSYVLALCVITPLMMLLLGSFRLGLISMIPNLFPIALTLGLMGWLGIPIEMFSLLIGSVALGLAVDDTIHFMHGFRRGYSRSGEVGQAVRNTLSTTGQALLFTSIVLSLGFAIYLLSELSNLRSFGLLTAFAIVMALLSDVLLAPALMVYTARFSSIPVDEAPAASNPA